MSPAKIIFVESIRWLGVRWGMGPFSRGLSRAGVDAEVIYWRWHSAWRGWTVLPAIMDRSLLEREAQRLADHIAAARRDEPVRAIVIAGYSCGGYVALRAIELLPAGVQVDAAVFFAGAFDPNHDMTQALSHVRGNIVNCSSKLDCLIVGLGTCLFGTAERTFGPSAGMVGLTHPSARDGRVVQVRWEPSMAAQGNFGDHFTAAAERFVAQRVATRLPGSLK